MTRVAIKHERQRQLVAEAQDAFQLQRSFVAPYQFNDGILVHHVKSGLCRFNKRGGGPGAWSDYPVYRTLCGRILSVESVNFTRSKKSVTCLTCVGRFRV